MSSTYACTYSRIWIRKNLNMIIFSPKCFKNTSYRCAECYPDGFAIIRRWTHHIIQYIRTTIRMYVRMYTIVLHRNVSQEYQLPTHSMSFQWMHHSTYSNSPCMHVYRWVHHIIRYVLLYKPVLYCQQTSS